MRREPKFKEFIESVRPDSFAESYGKAAITLGRQSMAKDSKKNGRQHKATWSTDKRKGGYTIRVMGPHADRFAGKVVPVEKKNGEESEEKLISIVWTGTDKDTGQPVALYKYEQTPREDEEPVF